MPRRDRTHYTIGVPKPAVSSRRQPQREITPVTPPTYVRRCVALLSYTDSCPIAIQPPSGSGRPEATPVNTLFVVSCRGGCPQEECLQSPPWSLITTRVRWRVCSTMACAPISNPEKSAVSQKQPRWPQAAAWLQNATDFFPGSVFEEKRQESLLRCRQNALAHLAVNGPGDVLGDRSWVEDQGVIASAEKIAVAHERALDVGHPVDR